MPSLRRAASRMAGGLPTPARKQLRRVVRGVERRLPGGRREPVTYVVSPHPDDETIRLAGCVTWLREHRPERMVLVAMCDGGSSARARKMDWSPEYEQEYRRTEQAKAWSALTGGTGEIIRVGLADGKVTAEEVRGALAPLNKPGAQFYVAAHEDDYHADHLAVVEGVRLLNPSHAWFALSPLMRGKGKVFKPPESAADAIATARAAYEGFGQVSVRDEFRAAAQDGHKSRLTAATTSPDPKRVGAPSSSETGPKAGPARPAPKKGDATSPRKPDLVVYDRFTVRFDPEQRPVDARYSLVLPTKESLAVLAQRYSPRQLSPRKHQILLGRLADPTEDGWLIQDADGVAGGFCCICWVDHYEKGSNYWMRLKPHQFLLFDDFVFRDHRRRGLHRLSIRQRSDIARECGRTEGVVLIRADNAFSRASYRSVGAKYAGRLYYSKRRGRSVMAPEWIAAGLRRRAGQQ